MSSERSTRTGQADGAGAFADDLRMIVGDGQHIGRRAAVGRAQGDVATGRGPFQDPVPGAHPAEIQHPVDAAGLRLHQVAPGHALRGVDAGDVDLPRAGDAAAAGALRLVRDVLQHRRPGAGREQRRPRRQRRTGVQLNQGRRQFAARPRGAGHGPPAGDPPQPPVHPAAGTDVEARPQQPREHAGDVPGLPLARQIRLAEPHPVGLRDPAEHRRLIADLDVAADDGRTVHLRRAVAGLAVGRGRGIAVGFAEQGTSESTARQLGAVTQQRAVGDPRHARPPALIHRETLVPVHVIPTSRKDVLDGGFSARVDGRPHLAYGNSCGNTVFNLMSADYRSPGLNRQCRTDGTIMSR